VHGKEKWGCPFSNKSTEPGQIYRSLFVDTSSIHQKTNGSCDVYNRSSAEKYHDDWHHRNISRKNEGVVPSDLTMVVCTQAESPFAFFGNTSFSFFTNDTHNDPLQLRSRSRRYGTWTGGPSLDLINVNYNPVAGTVDNPSIDLLSNSVVKVTCDDCYFYAGNQTPQANIVSVYHIFLLISNGSPAAGASRCDSTIAETLMQAECS